jgi:hypothetical protein
MKYARFFLGFSLAVLTVFKGFSQIELPRQRVDSSGVILFLSPNFSYHFVMADLKKEFGNNFSIGTDICLKTKSNWSIDFGFKYYFAGNVRAEIIDSSFKYIRAGGKFVPQSGAISSDSEVDFDFRGISFHLQAGKVFPVSNQFRNSGIVVKMGVGVMQHYLFINHSQETPIPALAKEYRKGYDRLTLGFSLNQFIGYMHLTKKNLFCLYGGVEFYEIFAQTQREYDFNLMRKDDAKLFESLIGIKIGWIIPLYKHKPYTEYEFR